MLPLVRKGEINNIIKQVTLIKIGRAISCLLINSWCLDSSNKGTNTCNREGLAVWYLYN